MLLAIGLYEITLSAISTRNLGYLIPLGLGTVTGILGTTRLLENCMKKKPKQTYLLILGFVIGSIADILLETGLPAGLDIVLSIAALLLGFVVIRMLSEKFSEA
jgi:putative membrane protein